MEGSQYALIGVIVVANLATIVAIWIFSMKVAVEFGIIKNTVKNNTEDIHELKNRLLRIDCQKVNPKKVEVR